MKNASGKLVILGILSVAIAAAGTAWWFRYNATRQALHFWGPQGSRLIRDASRVELTRTPLAAPVTTRDISTARGLTHLRNALLEDRSFQWTPNAEAAPKGGSWKLKFIDPVNGEQFSIKFSTDCRAAETPARVEGQQRQISTQPIAAGLREMFTEAIEAPATEESAPTTESPAPSP